MPWTETVVERDDVSIAVRDYGGEGQGVLLMPGAGRNVGDFGGVARELRPRRVAAMDPRGHGLTSPGGEWTSAALVADVEAVIERLGLDNPFVAGHSMGGMIAAFYGEAHPEAPGVVNIDGSGMGGPSLPAEVRASIDAERAAETVRAAGSDEGDEAWLVAELEPVRSRIEAMGLDWERAQRGARRSYLPIGDGRYRRRPSIDERSVINPTMRSWDLFALYHRVDCPLLIFHCIGGAGTVDDLSRVRHESLDVDYLALMADKPNVSVRRFEHGHDVHLENPVLAGQILMEFMSEDQLRPG